MGLIEQDEPLIDGGVAMHRNNEAATARHVAENYISYFNTGSYLEDFKDHLNLVVEVANVEDLKLAVCKRTEQACHEKEGYASDIFYAYSIIFHDMSIRIPLSAFHMGVLRELNVAPTQLHLNGWAFMQAFVAVCKDLDLTPMSTSFFLFAPGRTSTSLGYLLFQRRIGRCLPFSTLPIKEHPKRVIAWAKFAMTPVELGAINMINQLPRKVSSRKLIGYLGLDALCTRVFDYLVAMDKGKLNAFTMMVAQPKEELKKSMEGTSHPLIPKDKGKKKSSRKKSYSSQKRSKRSSLKWPLLVGSLDPNVWVLI
ncbi:hypothetical protein LR48_Vigan05g025500 [Vigna angularis]|uniref:Uncharacterized protein n=1 Tax=Phaseolus angularis TaxID=3914 RepID=A0A0L9UIY2_PHAAN|nr:hypothetical protein LR48_Vigan05g025500 [Vigna angularis]